MKLGIAKLLSEMRHNIYPKENDRLSVSYDLLSKF
mgnify:FL=1